MNNIFSRFFLLVLVTVCCFGTGAIAQEFKNLRVGIDGTFPPFSHRNIDGKYTGLDIDVTNAVCKILKAKCRLEQFPWANLIPALRGKKIDFVVAAIQANEASSDLVLLTRPYLKIPGMIIVRNDSILSGVEIEDLQDAQMGAMKSSSHAEYLRVHFPQTHIKTFDSPSGYFLELANRNIDGIIGDPVVLNDWLQSANAADCCRILGTLPHDDKINGTGYAIAVRPEQIKLLSALNKALLEITKTGISAKIKQRHLPFLN